MARKRFRNRKVDATSTPVTPVTPLETKETAPVPASPGARFVAGLEDTRIGRFVVRAVAALILLGGSSLYFQLVPLSLVLLGGYLGVNRLELTVDVLIYGLSGLAIVLPAVYFYSVTVAYVARRFIFTRRPRLSSPV